MAYKYHEQTLDCYRNTDYGGNSIYNSGCGPASLCNALDALSLASVTVKEMCAYSVSVGARIRNVGTSMPVLLSAASKKYGFVYHTTSKNAELLAHLKAGGAAILHAGNSYQLFSNSGHFVAAVAASGETITVLDSYWYSGKYTATALRRNYVSVVSRGVVKTSLTQCGKATIGRSPSYYLISKEVTMPEETETKNDAPKEDTEVIEKTKFNSDGTPMQMNAITKDGTTFVCLREYNNALGLKTGYDAANDTRTVDMETIALDINGTAATVPGMNIAGTTYGGIRAVFEAAGYEVGWDGESRTVMLKK